MYDNWLRILQDDEPPKSSWRPRKSTKSWDQSSVQKFTKVTQSRKKVHREGKLVPPSLVASMMCQNSRCTSREKTWIQSTKKLNENWDAISLVFLNAVLWERILAASGAHCTILSHIMLLNVWNQLLLRSKGKVQNWVRRRSYYLNLCEAHGLNTWGQLPHLMKNARKFSIMRRTSCSSLSRVLSTRSSCSTSPTSPTSLTQDYENLSCVQQQYEVRVWVNKHKESCYKPSHRTTNKHGETRCGLNCHEERCNRKRMHTHFLKDQNCEMQKGQNYLDSMQETHRWSHTSSSKIRENW